MSLLSVQGEAKGRIAVSSEETRERSSSRAFSRSRLIPTARRINSQQKLWFLHLCDSVRERSFLDLWPLFPSVPICLDIKLDLVPDSLLVLFVSFAMFISSYFSDIFYCLLFIVRVRAYVYYRGKGERNCPTIRSVSVVPPFPLEAAEFYSNFFILSNAKSNLIYFILFFPVSDCSLVLSNL